VIDGKVRTEAPMNAPPLVPGSRRGKPGRPRQGDTGIFGKPESGHTVGTVPPEPRASGGSGASAAVQTAAAPVSPRLLDLHVSAGYLGLSEWTVRTLEQQGILKRVRIPLPNHGELRKLLFDRADLDRLIDAWKDAR
jgi:hypothetical protein